MVIPSSPVSPSGAELTAMGVVLDLIEGIGRVPTGGTVTVGLRQAHRVAALDLVAAWCAASGNEIVIAEQLTVTVRHGHAPAPLAQLDPAQRPGSRVWVYTNFYCNLSCDYCCVRS